MERHVIIGTAGHIDHGKTTLIKALTGRDTDRLKEEKARGITIDLGFTWMDLTDGERVGIIDVPGHEKFISNMTAGVVGMDLVLLVIAADEGIMPQTREHLAILRLLGVENILVVLNKCDLVVQRLSFCGLLARMTDILPKHQRHQTNLIICELMSRPWLVLMLWQNCAIGCVGGDCVLQRK